MKRIHIPLVPSSFSKPTTPTRSSLAGWNTTKLAENKWKRIQFIYAGIDVTGAAKARTSVTKWIDQVRVIFGGFYPTHFTTQPGMEHC